MNSGINVVYSATIKWGSAVIGLSAKSYSDRVVARSDTLLATKWVHERKNGKYVGPFIAPSCVLHYFCCHNIYNNKYVCGIINSIERV